MCHTNTVAVQNNRVYTQIVGVSQSGIWYSNTVIYTLHHFPTDRIQKGAVSLCLSWFMMETTPTRKGSQFMLIIHTPEA